MCGIFGFWLDRPLTEADIARGRASIRNLAHRGPDGEGEWISADRGLYLAHRRLAIIDVDARSNQPMTRNNLTVSYNGEIYNYEELRRDLIGCGESFRTSGDTEVLLAGWEKWSAASLDRFDGMFAFALHDGHELVLATDPFGEKPLYVANTTEGMWFASEPRVLVDALNLQWKPSRDDLRHFMSLGFLPPPATGFQNLAVMPPATMWRFRHPKQFVEKRYWRPQPTRMTKGALSPITDNQVDDVGNALVNSLRYRLRSDVPIGLFLSSGIDSALVAALCAKELRTPLTAYTVAFPDGIDEAPAARAIADHLGLPHVTIASPRSKSTSLIPQQLADLYGVLNDNTSGLSVHVMSQLAKKHVSVALSGSGGDELAFGYNKYKFMWAKRNIFRVPAALFSAASIIDPVLQFIPAWAAARDYLAGNNSFRFLAIKNGGFANCLRKLGDGLPNLPIGKGELAFGARDLDLELTLPGSYLSAIDRGSMRVALEVRTPYLNRSVFNQVSKLDPRALLVGDQKILLRRIVARYLPRELYDRPKRGFISPLGQYVASLKHPPVVPGLHNEAATEIWAKRAQPPAESLLLRLGILEQFAAKA